ALGSISAFHSASRAYNRSLPDVVAACLINRQHFCVADIAPRLRDRLKVPGRVSSMARAHGGSYSSTDLRNLSVRYRPRADHRTSAPNKETRRIHSAGPLDLSQSKAPEPPRP